MLTNLIQTTAQPVQAAAKASDWHDVINIGGFASGLIGLLLALVSLWYAYIQTRLAREQKELAAEANFKVRTAEQAVRELKDELHRRNAAQSYELLSNRAESLVVAIRTSLWEDAYEAAQKLGAGIHNSMGAYSGLLDEEAATQMNECTAAVIELLRLLPVSGEDVTVDAKRNMQQLATIISFGNQRVAGKIRLIAETGIING